MRLLSRGCLLVLSLFFLSYQAVNGQSLENSGSGIVTKNGRPDIPGEIGFDLGLNYALDFPEEMSHDLIRSIYFSPHYKFEYFIPKTKFSILSGVSFGLEKYRFKEHVTIIRTPDAKNNYSNQVVGLDTFLINSNVKKSNLSVNYVEIPLEIRFRTNYEYPKKGFNFSAGGKIGYMFNAHTRYKYRMEGETKFSTQIENFDLSPFRYGVTGRVGYGIFNLFYYYSLNPLFQKDKGPLGDKSQPMIFGLSMTLF